MKAQIETPQGLVTIDFSSPIDISIPLLAGESCVNAFDLPAPSYQPFQVEEFIGSRIDGGPVNCENIFLNPHGNGTHTECVGHIALEKITINSVLKHFVYTTDVITVPLVPYEGSPNKSVRRSDLEAALQGIATLGQALVIRTLPNSDAKLTQKYSGNHPGFIDIDAMRLIHELGYEHLLVDLPSVDPEVDNGALLAHHEFWQYPQTQSSKTITEMVYLHESVADGRYILQFQIAAIESDASPSKPILYAVE